MTQASEVLGARVDRLVKQGRNRRIDKGGRKGCVKNASKFVDTPRAVCLCAALNWLFMEHWLRRPGAGDNKEHR